MKNTLSLLLLLCSFACQAYNQQSVYDFDIKHWGSAEGLSNNSVRSVSQDAQGYIWLATQYGLNRFDGMQFEHFNKETHRHLASNAITRLFSDSRGYMWVGTKAGLSGFDPVSLTFERYQILSEVTAIVEVSPGEIWVAADSLFRVRDGKVSRVEQIRSQVGQLELVNNQVWVTSTDKLFRIDIEGNTESFPLPAELMQTPIYDLYWTDNGLHIAGEAGFYHLDKSGDVKKCDLPDNNSTAVYKLLKDSRGNSWISAHRKLFHRHNGQKWQHITGDELGSYPWFSDIFEDKDHNIWLASFSDGIYRASVGNIRRIVPATADPVVRSLGVTPDNTLLIAGQSDVGELDVDGSYRSLLSTAQLGASTVHDVYWPDNQQLWLATDQGVLRYQRGQPELQSQFASLNGYTVRVLQPDDADGVWIGGVMGLFHYQNQTLTPFSLNSELESRHITVLQQQRQTLIFGTTRGLYQYESGRLTRLGVGSALYNSYITALQILPDNTVIAATLDDGIFVELPQQTQWLQWHAGNGLPHSPVVSLAFDVHSDKLWISSNKGIFRLDKAQLAALGQGAVQADEILGPYDRQLGTVPGRCCNGAGQAKVVRWQDQYWYPTLKGLVAVPVQLDQQQRSSLRPVIKSVQGLRNYHVDGLQSRLVLDLDDRNLSVQYSALEFIKPAALQFRYRLQGFDQHWHDVGDRREAVYTNLTPGRFVFQVQTRFDNGPWLDEQSAELDIVVPKRFDETFIYRGLWALLALFCLYGLLWLLRRNTVNQQLQLERLVRQRTQELENSNLKLNELNEQLTLLTHKDSLTGLRNRRFMFEQLPKDIEHFQRNRESMQSQGKCVALIHLDLDNFKQVNDQYGNTAGDSCIQQVAGILIRETRGSDYVVRFAGEEFVLVLRDIQTDLVEQFSYRLNELIGKTVFSLPDGHRTRLTCSVGYAIFPLDLLGGQLISWEISLQLAEMALYHVKHAGKNGVATIHFDQQVDAFEFEDSSHVEAQVERLLAAGLARFELKNTQL
ncbi:diguanylate cyclase [Rheinheimera aquimaris]|uniref:ligand-binding sensor domain-containing protein n=1 Tax=Rheinheimera aquimaris TaxID=412437 RepID=UPI001E34723B|nr:ligand-binding sensor domain-containing diguanylate cyclase [Rheinheimera aquimaris]MCD1598034.1 diguanylate cyclase [Rheinheimera aquimaris]